jgi:nicotinamide-nucleotide amidase
VPREYEPDRPRAVIVVTGSELVRGDRLDANGPFLAAELVRLGAEPARIVVVGDREEELEQAISEALEADIGDLGNTLGGIAAGGVDHGADTDGVCGIVHSNL